jgi:transcriptional regulator with GAF, ATPase, and Fis domain
MSAPGVGPDPLGVLAAIADEITATVHLHDTAARVAGHLGKVLPVAGFALYAKRKGHLVPAPIWACGVLADRAASGWIEAASALLPGAGRDRVLVLEAPSLAPRDSAPAGPARGDHSEDRPTDANPPATTPALDAAEGATRPDRPDASGTAGSTPWASCLTPAASLADWMLHAGIPRLIVAPVALAGGRDLGVLAVAPADPGRVGGPRAGRPPGHAGDLAVESGGRAAAGRPVERLLVGATASLLALAFSIERTWRVDVARRLRLEVLETVLPALARTLDPLEAFDEIAVAVGRVIPNDGLALLAWDSAAGRLEVRALVPRPPVPAPLSWRLHPDGEDAAALDLPYRIVDDAQATEPGPALAELAAVTGARSFLHVRCWFEEERRGVLWFGSRQPGAFDAADGEAAARLADYLALSLAHHQRALDAAAAAEARARAARLEARVEALADEMERRSGYGRLVGRSRAWRDALALATRVAAADSTVLLTGESGCGKEVLARFIHRGSARARGPFVAINCAALPETLLEAELFGYERGAFTGAATSRPGLVEIAAGGVLFLDEIGELPLAAQAKLLRLLDLREFQRLGAGRPQRADIRILAATNRDLRRAAAEGRFRDDLFYRLCVVEIPVPPLRERRDDIAPLAVLFLDDAARSLGRETPALSREALALLEQHAWPGNVRELRNVIERAAILCDGPTIEPVHLVPLGPPASPGAPAPVHAGRLSADVAAGDLRLDVAERRLVERALELARGRRTAAARLLGITRSQLYTRLKRYGL